MVVEGMKWYVEALFNPWALYCFLLISTMLLLYPRCSELRAAQEPTKISGGRRRHYKTPGWRFSNSSPSIQELPCINGVCTFDAVRTQKILCCLTWRTVWIAAKLKLDNAYLSLQQSDRRRKDPSTNDLQWYRHSHACAYEFNEVSSLVVQILFPRDGYRPLPKQLGLLLNEYNGYQIKNSIWSIPLV